MYEAGYQSCGFTRNYGDNYKVNIYVLTDDKPFVYQALQAVSEDHTVKCFKCSDGKLLFDFLKLNDGDKGDFCQGKRYGGA